VPGAGEVAATSYDVFGVFDTVGVRWLGNDGNDVPSGRAASIERTNRAAIIQQDPQGSRSPSPFGKTNGLGDIEVLCAEAPRIIGDRVWLDADGNGIQDPPSDGPEEPGIAGVRLQLRDATDTVIASTVTNEAGRYRFIVEHDQEYRVEIAPVEFTTGRLEGMALTRTNASDRGGADSDYRIERNLAYVRVVAPEIGGAVLKYDIGVVPVDTPPPAVVTTVPPTTRPTTTVARPPDELGGGRTSRPGDDLSSGRTSRRLASTGTTVAGMFSLSIGLMLLGLVLIGVPGVRSRRRADHHIEEG
jgi:hypothetical protein